MLEKNGKIEKGRSKVGKSLKEKKDKGKKWEKIERNTLRKASLCNFREDGKNK